MTEQPSSKPTAKELAFPSLLVPGSRNAQECPMGLTKREYFAAAALQGLLACPHQMCNDIENQAGLAVEYADRLIKELANE